ncbi:Xylulose kinase [Klebsiella pneumoniae]|uniref:Xylulose kinase n=1 Tax=Klebsiella pneumoniae TaxID=573 RepID=A0A4P0YAT7_KLEPN|nr:Xylulose kinase [Klebsiella pneumoniae]
MYLGIDLGTSEVKALVIDETMRLSPAIARR